MQRLAFFAAALFLSTHAWAQDAAPVEGAPAADAAAPAGDPLAKENWPLSGVDRPLGISAGMLQIDLWSATNLSSDAVAKPVALPLALWYGVTNELQLGIVHPVAGLCLMGTDNGCAKAYNDIGVQALYSVTGRGSSFEAALWGQFNMLSFDPQFMNAQVGAAINYVVAGGKVAILAYPALSIGLNERDAGNKEGISVPVYAFFKATDTVAPVLYTGIGGPLSSFGDLYAVPLGVGALVGISTAVDVGARLDFPNLAGKGGSADFRTLQLWASFRPL